MFLEAIILTEMFKGQIIMLPRIPSKSPIQFLFGFHDPDK
jgi:hypothetical protein